MSKLTHFDQDGQAVMVNVTDKAITDRVAIAEARIAMRPETLAHIEAGSMKKGDVLGVARLAGIMAAKRTPDLIPLCHPLALSAVTVDFAIDRESAAVDISATVKVTGKTGVEMEALTAASVAALTIYDMCKAVDRDMCIEGVKLRHKSGGKSGTYNHPLS